MGLESIAVLEANLLNSVKDFNGVEDYLPAGQQMYIQPELYSHGSD